MVAGEQSLGQWHTPFPYPPSAHNGDRCVTSVWGSHLGEMEIRRRVSDRVSDPHQLDGAESDMFGIESLPSIKGRLVQVFTDNTTAMCYYNK